MTTLSDSLGNYEGISIFDTNLYKVEDKDKEYTARDYEKISATVTYSSRDDRILHKDIFIKRDNMIYVFHTNRETRIYRKSIMATLIYKLSHVYKIEDSLVNKLRVLGKDKELEELETIKKLVENNKLTVIF